jgi:hypothetical protein
MFVPKLYVDTLIVFVCRNLDYFLNLIFIIFLLWFRDCLQYRYGYWISNRYCYEDSHARLQLFVNVYGFIHRDHLNGLISFVGGRRIVRNRMFLFVRFGFYSDRQ